MNKFLFCTEDYQYLKNELMALGPRFTDGQLERAKFPDSERYLRVLSNVYDSDCIVLGGTQTNDNTVEIYDLGSELVRQGAKSLTLVIPYFSHATMERAVKTGEVVKAKTRATLLSHIPKASSGNRVVLLELHADTIVGFFENNTFALNIDSQAYIYQAACDFANHRSFVLATTDVGRSKQVERVARTYDETLDLAFCYKTRINGEKTRITGINADVKDRVVVIYDDMLRSGSSLISAAKAYREHGATEVYAIVTHALFCGDCIAKIKASKSLDGLAITNSLPILPGTKKEFGKMLKVYSVADRISAHL